MKEENTAHVTFFKWLTFLTSPVRPKMLLGHTTLLPKWTGVRSYAWTVVFVFLMLYFLCFLGCVHIYKKPQKKTFHTFSQKHCMLMAGVSTCKCLNKERLPSPVFGRLFTISYHDNLYLFQTFLLSTVPCVQMLRNRYTDIVSAARW